MRSVKGFVLIYNRTYVRERVNEMAYSNVRIMPKVKGKMLPWTVIYHTKSKQWIITNDVEQHASEFPADEIQYIGFAETTNEALFIVWEHQCSLGLERTILDELREGSESNETTQLANSEQRTTDQHRYPRH